MYDVPKKLNYQGGWTKQRGPLDKNASDFIVRLHEQNDFITCIIWTNVFVVMFQSFVN